jgi:hypothetical protein
MTIQGSAFNFLDQEEDLYTEADLKEVYNGKKGHGAHYLPLYGFEWA